MTATDAGTGNFAPLTTGLIGYWRLEEGSGSTIHDLTSNHNDGTLGGLNAPFEPTWTASGAPSLGGGLGFNGVRSTSDLAGRDRVVEGRWES